MWIDFQSFNSEVVKYVNPRRGEARNLEEALMSGMTITCFGGYRMISVCYLPYKAFNAVLCMTYKIVVMYYQVVSYLFSLLTLFVHASFSWFFFQCGHFSFVFLLVFAD